MLAKLTDLSVLVFSLAAGAGGVGLFVPVSELGACVSLFPGMRGSSARTNWFQCRRRVLWNSLAICSP